MASTAAGVVRARGSTACAAGPGSNARPEHLGVEPASWVGTLEDWKKTTVSARDFDDWVNELENFFEDELTVGKAIKSLGKLKHTLFEVKVKGTRVELLFDAGEDTFRDFGGQVALLLRAGAVCGASGRFHFLGTAGAEYDFTYELALAKGRSTLKALGKAAIAKVYESDEYQAFNEAVMARLMASNPALKTILGKKK